MWKQLASTVAACALSMAQAPQGNAQVVYDLAHDFSLASNPNGVWSYGIFAPGTINPASFSLNLYPHTVAGSQGMLDIYSNVQNGDIFNLNPPYVSHNPLDSLTVLTFPGGQVIYQPHEAGMHPGPNGEYSVARFTAPNTADLYLAATFSAIDFGQGTTTDVHIWRNSTSLFDSAVNPGTSTTFAPARQSTWWQETRSTLLSGSVATITTSTTRRGSSLRSRLRRYRSRVACVYLEPRLPLLAEFEHVVSGGATALRSADSGSQLNGCGLESPRRPSQNSPANLTKPQGRSMIVGVPKEIKTDEYRVAMIPVGVEELTRAGQQGADPGRGRAGQRHQRRAVRRQTGPRSSALRGRSGSKPT